MKGIVGKKKVARIYIDSLDKYEGEPLWEHIVFAAKEFGLAGATVFNGIAGMGSHAQLHSFSLLSVSQELPIIVELIDDEAKVRAFLEKADEMIDEGLVTLADVDVIAYKHK